MLQHTYVQSWDGETGPSRSAPRVRAPRASVLTARPGGDLGVSSPAELGEQTWSLAVSNHLKVWSAGFTHLLPTHGRLGVCNGAYWRRYLEQENRKSGSSGSMFGGIDGESLVQL